MANVCFFKERLQGSRLIYVNQSCSFTKSKIQTTLNNVLKVVIEKKYTPTKLKEFGKPPMAAVCVKNFIEINKLARIRYICIICINISKYKRKLGKFFLALHYEQTKTLWMSVMERKVKLLLITLCVDIEYSG